MSRPAGVGRSGRAWIALAALVAGLGLLAAALGNAGRALVVARDVHAPEAIVSLASHEWERLPAAAALARANPSSRVLLTIPRVVTDSNCHQCGERRARLVDAGVAADRILLLPTRVTSTFDEAVAVRRYLARQPIRRLVIVTSPYHSRRALATFTAVLRALPVEIGVHPASATSPARPDRWWRGAYDRAYVTYEWTAAVYYRLKFGVPLVRGAARREDPARVPGEADSRVLAG